MNEVWLRVVIVGLTLLAVAAIVFWTRRPSARSIERINGLAPGIYLFTSSTCADCIGAKEKLIDVFGEGGFAEIQWEKSPDVFTRVGIDVVPCTVVVAPDGTSTLHPGLPGDDLAVSGP